jgi:hypothetical protein
VRKFNARTVTRTRTPLLGRDFKSKGAPTETKPPPLALSRSVQRNPAASSAAVTNPATSVGVCPAPGDDGR